MDSSLAPEISFDLRKNLLTVNLVGGGGTVSTITLPAFTTASRTSTISVTVLPTTVTEIDGVRWTFSMDQFTDLRSLTGSTTLTSTTLRDEPKASSTSSTTIFPFILVAPGGFYWSPVYPPGPTPPPLPKLPRLPSFPPVPNPPCFKLFGIFSINCPPDKQQPTTHFTRGPVKVCQAPQLNCVKPHPLTHRQPTCTANCGTLEDDSNDEESSSSTCRTATSTNCYTQSQNTVCNTYIGCECQTRTVTDAWVSCNDQTCTTTRTQPITGCYVSASQTTVGEYCPTPEPTDPRNYDDGSNDPDDGDGHGTHVAGIALGTGDSRRINQGYAPGAYLVDECVLCFITRYSVLP
mgnify:CR=1 FL=1